MWLYSQVILNAGSRYFQRLLAVLQIMIGLADVMSHHNKDDYNKTQQEKPQFHYGIGMKQVNQM